MSAIAQNYYTRAPNIFYPSATLLLQQSAILGKVGTRSYLGMYEQVIH